MHPSGGPISDSRISDLWQNEIRFYANTGEFERTSTTSQFKSILRFYAVPGVFENATEQHTTTVNYTHPGIIGERSGFCIPQMWQADITTVATSTERVAEAGTDTLLRISRTIYLHTTERNTYGENFVITTGTVVHTSEAERNTSSVLNVYKAGVLFTQTLTAQFNAESTPHAYAREARVIANSAELTTEHLSSVLIVGATFLADSATVNRYYSTDRTFVVDGVLHQRGAEYSRTGALKRFGEVIASSVVVGATSVFETEAFVSYVRGGTNPTGETAERNGEPLQLLQTAVGAIAKGQAGERENASSMGFLRVVIDVQPRPASAGEFNRVAGNYRITDGSTNNSPIIIQHLRKMRKGLIKRLL